MCAKLRGLPIPALPDASAARSPTLPTFLRAALEWLPVGVVVVADRAIMMANREAERLFGSPAPEMIGQSVDTLVPDALPPLDAERPRVPLPSIDTPASLARDLLGRRRDGLEVPLTVSVIPLPWRGTSFLMLACAEAIRRTRPAAAARADATAARGVETLIAELGAEFVGLRTEELDRAIEDALGRIVRLLDLDRGALFQIDEASGDFVNSHRWQRASSAPPPPRISARGEFPWHLARIRAGETVAITDAAEVGDEVDHDSMRRYSVRSAVTVPVTFGGRVWGALSLVSERDSRTWEPDLLEHLRTIAHVFGSVLSRQHADRALRQAMHEIATLRDRLRDENSYLRDELRALTGAPALVGHSRAFRRVLDQVRQVAVTESPVLLVGETGTGKSELAARIHDLSPRRARALVRVNCASLSMMAIEPAVFGVDKGAYAGGDARHVGRIEIADRSTVVFDEIADLPLEAQGRLLRVLKDRRVQPLGSGAPVDVDVRIIAATRVDLLRRIADGAFRDDLYYLLNVFTIHVPPLRERRDDIPLLVWRFVDEFAERYGKPIDAIDKESMLGLQQYAWWGNARELRNVVERAVIVSRDRHLRIPLPAVSGGLDERADELNSVEKEHITAVLSRCGWQIPGEAGAAARLGVSARVLRGRMRRLGIQRPH